MTRLSVVIACFNGESTLPTQLDALLWQAAEDPWEVVVSDNGSSDGSREIIAEYAARYDRLRLVDSSDAPGLAHARNAGARAACGRDLAFCDQDDEVAEGWLRAMISALDEHSFVAGRLEHERLNDTWTLDVRGRPQAYELLAYPELDYMPFAFGCTLGVRHALHDAISGFDPRFMKGCEDADYCWRMQRAGHTLVFVPDAVTHYRFRNDMAGIYRQARDYGESEALLVSKHRGLGLPPLAHPWRAALRMWLGTVRAALLPLTRGRRAVALWRIGQRVGRLTGSFRYGVFLP